MTKVYFDIAIGSEPARRIVMELFDDVTPRHWYRLARSYKRCNTGGSRNQANLE
jgi:hypothetical protein